MSHRENSDPERSQSLARKAAVPAVALLVVAGAVGWMARQHEQAPGASSPAASASHRMGAGPLPPGTQLADFQDEDPSPDARLAANWVVTTHDSGRHAFILVDKKDARVYVFGPDGHLKDSAPALLGEATGDEIAPGTGDKPLSEIRPEEKTTPAGRFVAEAGMNADDEDVIWVDYDDAISMHRVRPKVAEEHRLERLASLTTDDNRISFGCINLPVSFYEEVALPAVKQYGAVVYVLPEVKSLQQAFGAYDVTDPAQVAAAAQRQATVAQASGKGGQGKA